MSFAYTQTRRLRAAVHGGAVFCCAAFLSACALQEPAGDRQEPAPRAKSKASEAPSVYSRDQDAVGALRSDSIRLLVWNVQKAGSDQWIGDFRTLAADSDLVLLQEARLQGEFSQALVGLPRWDMVQAWQWRDAGTGVLTASDATPVSVHALEHREPVIRTDKSALVTEYRLEGSEKTLLVANIHAINFTIDTRAFRAQLIAIADLLDEHDGPVILSGDLNTWRGERHAIVEEIADALGLAEVAFEGPRKQFRQFPLDHVFYRDLEILSAGVATPVDSSDHNPLNVTFRYLPATTPLAAIDTGVAGAIISSQAVAGQVVAEDVPATPAAGSGGQ